MLTSFSPWAISRRTALTRLGAGALGVALTSQRHVLAQEASPAMTLPPEGRYARVNEVDLYYELRGDPAGPPVLLLHGGLGSTEDWANVWPALADAGYRVVLVDSRRHGRSGWGSAPLSVELFTADTVVLLDRLGIEATDVVGWSDGAVIGLVLAVNYPDRLRHVVAYGANFTPEGIYPDAPHPSDQLPPFEDLVAAYQRLSPQPERFEELAEELVALYTVAPDFTEEELGSITVPVLILDGAEEEFITPEHTRRLAEQIPGSELIFMPGTGHFAPLAKPAEFARIALAFLTGEAVGTPTAATPSA